MVDWFMRIIARSTLKRFVASRAGHRSHAALKTALDRIVFNVKGNDYRLVAAVDFEKGIVWIKWIGTHADYDKIDVRTVTYEKPKTASK